MKKISSIFCALALLFTVTACAPKAQVPEPTPSETSSDVQIESSEENPTATQSDETTSPEKPEQSEETALPENSEQSEETASSEGSDEAIKVMALKGPTAMGMLQLMERNEIGSSDNKYDFEIVGTADEIVSKLTTGEADIAAVPANLAATLYNKTNGGIKVCAVNTLGVLYILDTSGTVNTIQALKGKTIYSVGKGTTPEFALNYVLEKNGLADQVTIEYKSEATELAALLESGQAELAMLPEPYVTSVLRQNIDAKAALSLTDEWSLVQPDFRLITGTTVVTKKFAEENKEKLDNFLGEYERSIEFVRDGVNVDTAAIMAVKYGIVPNEAIARESLPRCNIVYIDGSAMQRDLSGYLGTLFEAEPKSVGGALPDDGFYYKK